MNEREAILAEIAHLQRLLDAYSSSQDNHSFSAALEWSVDHCRKELENLESARPDSWMDGIYIRGWFREPPADEPRAAVLLRADTNASAQIKPLNAEFLFYLFVDPQNCDALVGDLDERYKLIHKKFGRRRADFWYWTMAVRSLGPIVWAWGKQKALKPVLTIAGWAVAKGLIGHDGWLAAVVELLKRVRS